MIETLFGLPGVGRLNSPSKAAHGVKGTCSSSETPRSLAKRLELVSAGPRRCVFGSTPDTTSRRERRIHGVLGWHGLRRAARCPMKITEKWIAPSGCGKNRSNALPSPPPILTRGALASWLAPPLFGLALSASGCDRTPPPGATAAPSSVPVLPQAGSPALALEPIAAPKSSGQAAAAAPAGSEGAPSLAAGPTATPPDDYKGPWLAITASAAGVYAEPSFEAKKLGYLRNGGRGAVDASTVSKKNCTAGWYKLLSGGFVCGNLGTTDSNHPDVKFATRGRTWTTCCRIRMRATRRTAHRSTSPCPRASRWTNTSPI